jgi:hypothetical protein
MTARTWSTHVAATGYLLTAFLIWALAVALCMTRDDTKPALTQRGQRHPRKRFGMRPVLRRMRSSQAERAAVPLVVVRAGGDELRSRTL